jgi:hypothetical protein
MFLLDPFRLRCPSEKVTEWKMFFHGCHPCDGYEPAFSAKSSKAVICPESEG